jgi:hypothetical protein
VADLCEHGNELSCSINGRDFLTRFATTSFSRIILPNGVGSLFTLFESCVTNSSVHVGFESNVLLKN